jgi:hypothetical protein
LSNTAISAFCRIDTVATGMGIIISAALLKRSGVSETVQQTVQRVASI